MDNNDSINSSEPAQPLQGFLSNEEWDTLLTEVNAQIQTVTEIPYPGVPDQVFTLLQGIDTIHREALHRLVRLFKEGVLEQVITDPAIHTLMELYDLLPTQASKKNFPNIPIKVIPKAAAQVTPVAQAAQNKPPPHWVPVLQSLDELSSGQLRAVTLDDRRVLLCRNENALFAIDSLCSQDHSSLEAATLKGYTLVCPNHSGCLYDIRQGTRIASTEKITCYAVKIDDDGRVFVGLGVEFQADLPSF